MPNTIARDHVVDARVGLISLRLDDAADVEIMIHLNDDAVFKVVLTPAEAVRFANEIMALR